MGEQDVTSQIDDDQLREFMKALLADVHALERILDGGMIETGVRRIGAEQEMFLVDSSLKPSLVAQEVLADVGDDRLTTELAQFNLEANLSPLVYGGKCLSELEAEATELVTRVQEAAANHGSDVLLCGILPTLQKSDLGLDSMTPLPRYRALDDAIRRMRGGTDLYCTIKGLDELEITHDNVMLEACNTSFQIHFQCGADEFARLYNLAQAVSSPVLAAAVNSPLLLGKRLWQETRVALFQRSVDARSQALKARGHRPRVSFGDAWIDKSILEIYREDIARFRVFLAGAQEEDPQKLLDRGETPRLRALCLHNGTVWRWNRACYGVADNVPHLRIENRVLPSGPTILDEIANSAFFFGLMSSLAEEFQDITRVLDFDDVKNNFFAASRHGLSAQLDWIGGRSLSASELVLELVPQARDGLRHAGIDAGDIDRYLGVIEDRVRSRQTGAQWALRSVQEMGTKTKRDVRDRTLARAMLSNQRSGAPVHRWPLADADVLDDWRHSYKTIGQLMSTDLFTVRPHDLVDLAASVMDWEHIRHVPVEDDHGRLVGLLSHRSLLRLVARRGGQGGEPVTVESLMKTDPVTVAPDLPTLDAIALMRSQRVGCLPVVDADNLLLGVVTEHDFLEVAAKLFESQLKQSS